jgi:O-phosphoseryl-tRNA(Cys) synthetase
MRPRHELSELKPVKTRGTLEAHCTCGWMLTAPASEEKMARSNYELHERRFCVSGA